jgi:cell division protease FtsH
VLYRVAVHEAGHALLAALEIGTDGLVVALQSRGGAGGWVEFTFRKRTAVTRAAIDAEIRILFAGRAAEEAILGDASAGARNDLAAATSLAAHAVGAWGLAGHKRLLSNRHDDSDAILDYPEVRQAASAMLARQYARTIRTVRRHRAALLRIADRLMVERRLDGATVSGLLNEAPPAGTDRREFAADEDAPRSLDEGRGQ